MNKLKIEHAALLASFALAILVGTVLLTEKASLKTADLNPRSNLAQVYGGSPSWSGIISSSRAIDWGNAGLPATFPDGETTPNPWTPPIRTQCVTVACQTLTSRGSASTVAQINSAIASAPAGTYVLLPPGNYNIDSYIAMFGVSNITLRGSGPMQTNLNITNGNQIFIGQASGFGSGLFSTNYPKGATSITLNSVSGAAPAVGMIAFVSQCDTGSGGQPCSGYPVDNGSIFISGDYNQYQTGSNSNSVYSHQQQTVFVTNVQNNGNGSYTLTISSGLYMSNWTVASGAMISWQDPSKTVVGLGLEDLTVTSFSNTSNENVLVQQAYASWIKGVRFIGAGQSALKLSNVKSGLVMNNYFVTNFTDRFQAGLYMGGSADNLILNNIAAGGIPSEYLGGNVGNVTAYNMGRDSLTAFAENVWAFDHRAFSSFGLWEGNQSSAMTEDNIWGTHGLNTYFRNYSSCYDDPYIGGSPNPRGIDVNNYHRFENLIGNALGSSLCTEYQGTGYGSAFRISTGDPLVLSTMFRWGNVTVAKQSSDTPSNTGIRYLASEVPSSLPSPNTAWQNAVPNNNFLPASFFMNEIAAHPNGGTGLNWWKVCTNWSSFPSSCSATQVQSFPIAGPDLSGGPYVNGFAYDTPAAIAWKSLPIDTTYQKSYTITGSSWSNGTETLTISGLPNSPNLLGGFQLSGVNPACIPSSGVSYTGRSDNEILITKSSATTISYALASDPGVSCIGTFKFPNVRQFDQSVFVPDLSQSTTHTLSIQKSGTGSGTVTGGTINCGTTSCTQTANAGTSIILTATQASGSTFTGWSGGGCSGTGTCTVTLNENTTVTATFTEQSVPTGNTITAASCSRDDVQTAINQFMSSSVTEGTILIPAGNCTWTQAISGSLTKSLTIQGAGAISSLDRGTGTTGSDQTIILDRHPTAHVPHIFDFTVSSGKKLRITGIAFKQDGSSVTTQAGVIKVVGGSNSIRIDHNHFVINADSTMTISVYGGATDMTGVIDHNYFDSALGNGPFAVYLQNGSGFGDAAWAAADSFGSDKFLFVEDNRWRNGYLGDANTGGQRFVFRYNTGVMEGSDGMGAFGYVANHGTTNGRGRSTRAFEYYGNNFSAQSLGLNKSPFPVNGGTGLVWGNTISQYRYITQIDYTRKSNASYNYGNPPTGWGNCTGSVGTVWDGQGGYPCLDGPGRGAGDLLSGDWAISSVVNTRTSTQSWPQQVLSPIYVWANLISPASGYSPAYIVGAMAPSLIQANRDFYQQFGAYGETGSFDGTRGVGEGTLSARPTTCTAGPGGNTPGVGYWATDQNKLYVCTSTNTWSLYYTPYVYPHPLSSGSNPFITDTTLPTVSITSPSSGTVSGNVTITATASDNVGVVGVRFYAGTTNLGEDTSSPYSYTWNTVSAVNGSHTLKAVARDAAGNTKEATVTVTVSNVAVLDPDTTDPTMPSNAVAVVQNTNGTSFSWSASTDPVVAGQTNSGISKYNVYRNGSLLRSVTTLNTSDSGLAYSTSYCYAVEAVDVAQNVSTRTNTSCVTTGSAPSTPDTTPPSVPTNLTGSAVSQAQINLSWGASTDPTISGAVTSGLAGYKVYRNNVFLANVTGGATTFQNNSGIAANTTYTYQVSAYDNVGLESARSNQITVTTPPAPNTGIQIGDRVQTTNNLKVRATASTKGSVVGTAKPGTKGTVMAGPAYANGYTWWNISYDNGVKGWSAQNWLLEI